MLPKKNRVDRKGVNLIFKEGRSLTLENITFKYLREKNSSAPRISFVVPKSVSKLAVKRNFLRRLGYSALSKYINDFPLGLLGVFLFKKYEDNLSNIENEIKSVLNKIN